MRRLREELTQIYEAIEKSKSRPLFFRARETDALFVTDCCRRCMYPETVKEAFEKAKYAVTYRNDLWYIEPDIAFYHRETKATDILQRDDHMTLYYLYSLLKRHEVQLTDAYAARLFVKADEAGEMQHAIQVILRRQAMLLREERPLDGLLISLIEEKISC